MDDVQQRLAQMEASIGSQPPQAPQAKATQPQATRQSRATLATQTWSVWQWALAGLGVLLVGTLALQLVRFVMGLLGLALFIAVAYFAYRFFTRPNR